MSTDSAKAYITAVRLLGRREYSVAELKKKLHQKHPAFDQQALDSLLLSLQQDGLLSDVRFTESLIRGRVSRGYGPYYITRELASKGIDSELGERLLEEAAVDWSLMLQDLIARRHPSAAEDQASWLKAARFLQRRGFSSELVMRTLGERPY